MRGLLYKPLGIGMLIGGAIMGVILASPLIVSAIRSMQKWKDWDEQYSDSLLPRLYYETGDIIMREEMTPSMEQSMANWGILGHPYEVLTPEEVRYRWPMIQTPEMGAAMYEPAAGVVRARRAMESVARVFQQEGGELRIVKAAHGDADGRMLQNVQRNGHPLPVKTSRFSWNAPYSCHRRLCGKANWSRSSTTVTSVSSVKRKSPVPKTQQTITAVPIISGPR